MNAARGHRFPAPASPRGPLRFRPVSLRHWPPSLSRSPRPAWLHQRPLQRCSVRPLPLPWRCGHGRLRLLRDQPSCGNRPAGAAQTGGARTGGRHLRSAGQGPVPAGPAPLPPLMRRLARRTGHRRGPRWPWRFPPLPTSGARWCLRRRRSGCPLARCHAPAGQSAASAWRLQRWPARPDRPAGRAGRSGAVGPRWRLRPLHAEAAKPLQRLHALQSPLLQRVPPALRRGQRCGPRPKRPLARHWRHASGDTAACLRPGAGRCRFRGSGRPAALAAPVYLVARPIGQPRHPRAKGSPLRLLASALPRDGADTGPKCLPPLPESGGGWWVWR